MQCSFCGAANQKLMSSTDADWRRSYICPLCVEQCTQRMAEAPESKEVECTFCHGRWGGKRFVSSERDPPKAVICDKCLMFCRHITEDDKL